MLGTQRHTFDSPTHNTRALWACTRGFRASVNEAVVAMDGVAIVIIALLGAGFVAAAAGAARVYFAHYLPLLRATQQAAVVTYPEAVASSTLPSPDRQRRRSSNGAGQARAEPPAPLVLPQEGPYARLQDGGGGSMHTARAAESMLAVPDAVLDGDHSAAMRQWLHLWKDVGAVSPLSLF